MYSHACEKTTYQMQFCRTECNLNALPPCFSGDSVLAQVSAAELGAWPQHTVYFGSTVVSVCRGMTTRQVAAFFARGVLCVRAYDPSTGQPVPYLLVAL